MRLDCFLEWIGSQEPNQWFRSEAKGKQVTVGYGAFLVSQLQKLHEDGGLMSDDELRNFLYTWGIYSISLISLPRPWSSGFPYQTIQPSRHQPNPEHTGRIVALAKKGLSFTTETGDDGG